MSEKPEELIEQALRKFAEENPEKLKEILKPKEGEDVKPKEEKPEEETKKEEIKESRYYKPYGICGSCGKPVTREEADKGSCPHCGGPDYTRIRYS